MRELYVGGGATVIPAICAFYLSCSVAIPTDILCTLIQ